MANFSVNQVRQLFVLKENKDTLEALKAAVAAGTANPGDFAIIQGKEIEGGDTCNIRVAVVNPKNEIVVSPVITKGNFLYGNLKPASAMTYPARKITVTLNSKYLREVEDEGDTAVGPISGQDYILRLYLNQYFTDSDEDQYIKYGCVHATSTMTTSQFYVQMAKSLFANLMREQFMPVSIICGGVTLTKENFKTFDSATGFSASNIVIEANPLPWTLGKIQFKTLDFDVVANNILLDGDEVCWAEGDNAGVPCIKVEYDATKAESNSKMIADLEFFCHGFRGDIYRNMGWPYNIDTEYQVNGKDTSGYDVLNIHVAYSGDNEAVQKSEKDITFVIPTASAAELEEVKEAIEDAFDVVITAPTE